MAIKPLEDRVVIKIEQAEQTTASGLVIPETAKEKPQEARVVAVGPGRVDEKGNRIPVDIKEGDVVVFSRYGGTEVKYQGEEYLILPHATFWQSSTNTFRCSCAVPLIRYGA